MSNVSFNFFDVETSKLFDISYKPQASNNYL